MGAKLLKILLMASIFIIAEAIDLWVGDIMMIFSFMVMTI